MAVRHEDIPSTANSTTARAGKFAFGSSWNHEEAIQDAERTRKN
jgi:hypothetical protein